MTSAAPRHSAGAFHEWPLVLFTTLAIAGAGLLAAPLLAWLISGSPAAASTLPVWGIVLLGAGLAVSTAHLGRPLRAPRAALALGRSRLSAEVVLAGSALVLGALAMASPAPGPALYLAAGAASLAFLVSLGLVYSLPGQQTWRGAVVWSPLTEGLAFSAVAFLAFATVPRSMAVPTLAAILAGDLALLVARWTALARPRHQLAPRFPALCAHWTLILAARLALVDLLPPLGLALGLPWAALAASALGILVARVAFYGFASQHTTEAELDRVEQAMAG